MVLFERLRGQKRDKKYFVKKITVITRTNVNLGDNL